uniref:hypothetical protein n=1 Tax=Clostridium sp. ZBS20 TaxID=2949966 RepID=UPI00207A71DA
ERMLKKKKRKKNKKNKKSIKKKNLKIKKKKLDVVVEFFESYFKNNFIKEKDIILFEGVCEK